MSAAGGAPTAPSSTTSSSSYSSATRAWGSPLLLRFADDTFEELSPTIGVDFKLKYLDLDGKRLKLTVWDTAGQERFRTLTSSYYRGAQGIVFVYDITRRDTFDDLAEIWQREVDMYSTVEDCVKIVIGNKVDKAEQRAVSREEGMAFARDNGCLFLECSAKTKVSVQEAFEELVRGCWRRRVSWRRPRRGTEGFG